MKEVQNWEALIKEENGDFKQALPLPGCFIKGEIEGNQITLENAYIDFSNFIVTAGSKDEFEKYKLGQANQRYIGILNEFIEYAKNKSNEFEIGE